MSDADYRSGTQRSALIDQAIHDWRDSLVNLTRSNRLLNFRVTRTSTVVIDRPSGPEVLENLASSRKLRFRSLKPTADEDAEEDADNEPPPPSRDFLDTLKNEADLAAALRNLLRRSNQEFLDRGLQVLHLAVGTLKWSDVDGSNFSSPLLLVPVQLVSTGPRQMPMLEAADEDPQVNPALALKFAQFDIELPSVDDLDDLTIDGFLDGVRHAVRARRGWTVEESVSLSYFSFAKEAMYRDLLDNEALIAEHPAVQAFATGGRGDGGGELLFDEIPESRIDTDAAAESTPLVLDADSSQRAAIAAAVAGKSFVMDGPPGTGKSQTIANMVGALLHAGKSVLFVSEKAAALEVVRNRLTDVGLNAYLLELHSHKATRKEVARALGEALDTHPVAPPAMSELDVKRARQLRESLNDYSAAMNERREPLGYSLHDVLGLVAQLQEVPVAQASRAKVAALDTESFGQIRAAAAALSRSWRPAAQGESFLWRDVIDPGSLEARLYRARSALESLQGTVARHGEVRDAFTLTRPSDAERLNTVLGLAATRPAGTPESWLTTETPEAIANSIADLDGALALITTRRDALTHAAGTTWDAIPAMPVPTPVALTALTPAGIDPGELTVQQMRTVIERFVRDAEMLTRRQGSLAGLAALLGVPEPSSFSDAAALLAIAAVAESPDRPEAAWLTPAGYNAARNASIALRAATQQLADTEAAAAAYYTPAALAADTAGLARRFAEEHHGIQKNFRSEYKADKKTVAAFTRPGIEPDAAHSQLALAAGWSAAAAAFSAAEAQHAAMLGRYYAGRATDFTRLDRALTHAYTVITAPHPPDAATAGVQISLGGQTNPTLISTARETRADLDTWRASVAPSPTLAPRPELVGGSLSEAITWLRAHIDALRATAALTETLDAPVGRELTYDGAVELLRLRAAVEDSVDALHAEESTFLGSCGELYNGVDTDASIVHAAWEWAKHVRAFVTGVDAPLTPEQVKAVHGAEPPRQIADASTAWSDAMKGIVDAFGPTRHSELTQELDDFANGASLLEELENDTSGPDEWFSYHEAREELDRHGLDDVVDFCVRERVQAEQVPPVIDRSILQAWADHHLGEDRKLGKARAQDRDALIDEYRRLDRELVVSATGAIIRSANARRPKTDVGQAALIRREAERQRKHMPVRELIRRTASVTQAIKPCFMMSPLAVSQFLPPDMKFDVVIFDEASQVSPGDAINCIYRGRSLITAGDQKQLPPTSFFSAAGTDDGDEWSEDSENAKDFESILDLAKSSGNLRSLTLRWHYRSRHEALIAFSNVSFYDGRLITFPSAEDTGPHVGVELFNVEGVYRRGTTRDNLVEAAKVAERVIYHYDHRPTLTLGVVAFSEAQATAIELAVDQARLERPDLERHFTNDRLDGFFVKNLESVQGDERDVMIFSIGYGPDENGKTTMNFGPVNGANGWRRLNVAVTRARHRNEIVSSIRAGDITDTAQSDGIRHLRRYLDYAERGIAALALDVSSGGDVESPFEESVLAVLRSWGFDVVPQVGAAGYRIDLGVRHPDHPSVYVLGVECDGYQYHSSKVARDRDRLREQVLRGLGWQLHRIWGTAWYRDRQGEEARLRSAVDAAVAAPVSGLLGGLELPDLVERPEVFVEEAVFDEVPEWAEPYRTANVKPLARWIDPSDSGSRFEMRPGIEAIAKAEGPVHRSILDQRLREAWNIGRVGARIRENIDAAIKLAVVDCDGDFIGIPDGPPTVRTPTEDCARKVEQVHPYELGAAIVNTVRDAASIEHDALTAFVARLYGWNRRGADIAGTLDALIADLVEHGELIVDGDAYRLGMLD